MNIVAQFWLVYRIGATPLPREHPTFESACHEAERLAVKHSGELFAVLGLVRVCQAREPVEWTDYAVGP